MSQQMGIGELGNPSTVFVREFRFIIKGKYLSESFNKSVSFDYTGKRIFLQIYEVCKEGEIHAHTWADGVENGQYQDEELQLITFDGSGEELYSKKFYNLKVVHRRTRFDYSSNEVGTHEVILSYEKYENVPVESTIHKTQPRKTHIDHLNARMHIDG